VGLVNELAVDHVYGRPVGERDPRPGIARVLEIDPSMIVQLSAADIPAFMVLARQLHGVFRDLRDGDMDVAAARVNDLLARHPAHPHLAKEDGRWRLHHHPADAPVVPMATAFCAEALARMIGAGEAGRLGTCRSDGCDRVFVDSSKNGSRRFCSTTCQNRVKAAAFRRRHATGST